MISGVSCIDLFCGAGGLTRGLQIEGINVAAGIDIDPACEFPYEENNQTEFIQRDISKITGNDLNALFGNSEVRVLAGCAPCQPFSTYAQRYELNENDGKWGLLYQFGRLVCEAIPDIVTMENVPAVARHAVFRDFVKDLERFGYHVDYEVVDSSAYGVPQLRRRLVLLASRRGDIKMIGPKCDNPRTVRDVISLLPQLRAGQASPTDRLHVAATLSETNLKRIKASRPGGSWRDWPENLVAKCHRASSGRNYRSVYGRMEWDKPAPTMTTQCFGFGNGRFGHPEQNRAISLREAALLQSFPRDYLFAADEDPINFKVFGRLIGNAVPVELARAIGQSIAGHLDSIAA